MDRSTSSQQPPPSSENPVVAVGRKVKAVFTSQQQPSVRIIRGSPSSPGRNTHHKPLTQGEPNPSSTSGKGGISKIRSWFSGGKHTTNNGSPESEYDTDTVDLLDVVDPEVATLSTLTNVQNSLFVPQLGRIVNRRAAYRISDRGDQARTIDKLKTSLKRISSPTDEVDEKGGVGLQKPLPPRPRPLPPRRKPLTRTDTLASTLSESRYAVLPHGETLPGWTHEDKEELDDLVRHMLHSRRAKFKRSMRGFWQYVRRPLGLFITVYATLITLFGAAWVFFLIGWVSLGSKKDYIVDVVDNVLVALFAIIGDGLAPFRAVDTYHMIYIARFHRKTHKRREKIGLPELVDRNDLPDQRKEEVENAGFDIESLCARRMPRGLARVVAPRIPKSLAARMTSRSKVNEPAGEYTVLTEDEQTKLEFHERKFSKSHTFYKPHETETHYAFPLKFLVAIVILLDCHSALQITLGACTWGIPYKRRPFALTTVVLCFSITCNILGGVLISMGDKRTRKKDVIERMMRQELTSEAIEEMERRWMKEAEERGEIDPIVRKRLEEEREEAENEEIKKAWKVVPSLPKTLLGKGEDHRQEPLPPSARRSSAQVNATGSGSTTPKNNKSKSSVALPPVQESPRQPTRPQAAARRGNEAPEEGTGRRILRLVRRADLDRS